MNSILHPCIFGGIFCSRFIYQILLSTFCIQGGHKSGYTDWYLPLLCMTSSLALRLPSFLPAVAFQQWLGHSCKGSTYVNLSGNYWDVKLLKRFSEVLRSSAQSMVLTVREDIWYEHLIIILICGLYTIWRWLYRKIQTIQTSVGPLYTLPLTTESVRSEYVF